LSARQITPASVQRAPVAVPSSVRAAVEAELGTSLGSVVVHRSAESATAARDLGAHAFTSGGEVHIPDHHGPLESGTGMALLAHELTHVAQQRALGGSRPHEDTAHGRRLEVQAMAIEQRVASGRLPLVTPASKPSASSIASETVAAALKMPGAHVEANGSVSFTSSSPSSFGGGASTSAPAPTPSSHAGPQRKADDGEKQDLDQLAKDVYDLIETRLKSELRLGRERAGQITDLR
jgi:hypothetical protein